MIHLQPGPASPEARPNVITDAVQQQPAVVSSDPAASGVSDAELLDALGHDVQIYTCDHGADGPVTVADCSNCSLHALSFPYQLRPASSARCLPRPSPARALSICCDCFVRFPRSSSDALLQCGPTCVRMDCHALARTPRCAPHDLNPQPLRVRLSFNVCRGRSTREGVRPDAQVRERE